MPGEVPDGASLELLVVLSWLSAFAGMESEQDGCGSPGGAGGDGGGNDLSDGPVPASGEVGPPCPSADGLQGDQRWLSAYADEESYRGGCG